MTTQLNYESAKLLAQQTDGKLTADDVINLATYGTTNAQDMNPEVDDLVYPKCMCGEINCPDAYAHMTSGC